MFWKMVCREQRCHRGRANSMRANGKPWSNSCVLSMVHRWRTQHNDQPSCARSFRPERSRVQTVREAGSLMRHILGPLLLAASALLVSVYKGVDQDQTSTISAMSSPPATPADEQSQLVRQGRAIFDETPRHAPSYTG